MNFNTTKRLDYRGPVNMSEKVWAHPMRGLVESVVEFHDGAHRSNFITNEGSEARSSEHQFHHVTAISVNEQRFENQGEERVCLEMTVVAGGITAKITFFDLTNDQLMNALLAERIGEALLG